MSDDFRKRKVWRVNIEVAFDNLEIWGNLTEEVVCLLVGQVAQAEDLTYLARGKEFLELL